MSTTFRAGLTVLGLLSLVDLASPLLTDGQTPPMFIALIGSALGAFSLVLVTLAWPGRRAPTIGLIVLRLLSALTAVPAFFEPDVPGVATLAAGIAITLTLAAVVLVLSGMRRAASPTTVPLADAR